MCDVLSQQPRRLRGWLHRDHSSANTHLLGERQRETPDVGTNVDEAVAWLYVAHDEFQFPALVAAHNHVELATATPTPVVEERP